MRQVADFCSKGPATAINDTLEKSLLRMTLHVGFRVDDHLATELAFCFDAEGTDGAQAKMNLTFDSLFAVAAADMVVSNSYSVWGLC